MMKRALLATAALLLLAACNKDTPGAIVDPALSTLVPADTIMLVGIRFEELKKSPLYERYLKDRAIGPIDEFAEQTGLDVRRNLWETLLISNGKTNVMIARGKFSNEAEPRLAIELKGGKRTNYRDFTLIGDDKYAVALMGPSQIAMGDVAGLKQIIDTRDKTNGPPAVLAARMKEIPSSAAIWSAYAGSPIEVPEDAPANMGNLIRILNSVESGLFYLDVRSGVNGKATGITGSDAAGKELHDALRGMVGLGRLMAAKDDTRLQRLFDGLRVTQEGRIVNLYIDQQEEAITTLMDFMLSGPGRARPRK